MAATTPRNVKVAVATGDSREILAIPKRTSRTFGKSTMTRYEVKGARFVSPNVRSVRPPDCEIRTGFGEYASCAVSMPAGRTTSTVRLSVNTLHPVPTACQSSRFRALAGWRSAFVTVYRTMKVRIAGAVTRGKVHRMCQSPVACGANETV